MEQKDPVAQSKFAHFIILAVDLSERDNKETLVIKEEETYYAEVFEEVEAEVVRLLKEPQSLVVPPPGSSMSPPGSSTARDAWSLVAKLLKESLSPPGPSLCVVLYVCVLNSSIGVCVCWRLYPIGSQRVLAQHQRAT